MKIGSIQWDLSIFPDGNDSVGITEGGTLDDLMATAEKLGLSDRLVLTVDANERSDLGDEHFADGARGKTPPGTVSR